MIRGLFYVDIDITRLAYWDMIKPLRYIFKNNDLVPEEGTRKYSIEDTLFCHRTGRVLKGAYLEIHEEGDVFTLVGAINGIKVTDYYDKVKMP